jgi:hypothetical protein
LRCKGAVTATEPVNQLLILTTSTAPGILFAAHELGAETHVYYDRASEHGFAHGQEIFNQGLMSRFFRSERAKLDASRMRVLPSEITFAKLQAPIVHGFIFREVAPALTTPTWRSTVDNIPSGEAYERVVCEIADQQFGNYSLYMQKDETRDAMPPHIQLPCVQ